MNNNAKDIITFLKELSYNNNREWFTVHKDWYLEVKEKFECIAQQLMTGIADFDSSCNGLSLKDCTYRIYRDIRFCSDKSPYKTHFGVYVCPGGKKSGYAGYYFHISSGNGNCYPSGHMLAVGDYRYDPAIIKTIREDILYGNDEFQKIMDNDIAPVFWLDEEDMLTRVPKGFPSDSPVSKYLRLKNFCLCYHPSEQFITDTHMVENTLKLFKTTYPFTQFINRAIHYVKTEL